MPPKRQHAYLQLVELVKNKRMKSHINSQQKKGGSVPHEILAQRLTSEPDHKQTYKPVEQRKFVSSDVLVTTKGPSATSITHVRSGSLYEWAKKKFCNKDIEDCSSEASCSSAAGTSQGPLHRLITEAVEKNYIRLFNTALALAMPEKPFTDFPFTIEMQKRNGVNFMPGKDDKHSCSIFVHFLVEAIQDDIKSILASMNSCGEIDGSEARKTR